MAAEALELVVYELAPLSVLSRSMQTPPGITIDCTIDWNAWRPPSLACRNKISAHLVYLSKIFQVYLKLATASGVDCSTSTV